LEEVCKSALELEHSRPTLYTLEVPVEEFKKKKKKAGKIAMELSFLAFIMFRMEWYRVSCSLKT
jgi:hypothetical protein